MAAIGLDFGTSTTGLAAHRDQQVSPLADEAGEEYIPSVWACTPTGRIQVGVPAKRRILIDPTNTLHSVKRVIGRRAKSAEFREFERKYGFDVVVDELDIPHFRTRMGDLTAEEVARQILDYARVHFFADELLPARATISIPVSFNDAQREAILRAAEGAGFGDLDLITEPFAAALGYLNGRPGPLKVAVFDLGGGTLDFALMEWSGDHANIYAAGGDSYLGGDDIDLGLFDWASMSILSEHRWDVRNDRRASAVLRLLCEQAKIQLSTVDDTWINLTSVDDALKGGRLHVSRHQLEQVIQPLMQRAFLSCDRVLADSKSRADDLDVVVCVGGCANIPSVRSAVEAYFRVPVETGIPPDRVVVLGAAYHAGIRHRSR